MRLLLDLGSNWVIFGFDHVHLGYTLLKWTLFTKKTRNTWKRPQLGNLEMGNLLMGVETKLCFVFESFSVSLVLFAPKTASSSGFDVTAWGRV